MDNYRELKIRCDPGFGHLQWSMIYSEKISTCTVETFGNMTPMVTTGFMYL